MKRILIVASFILCFILLASCSPKEPAVEYTVSWYDEAGALLKTEKLAEGATPSFTYTKADTVEWDYTVEGWATAVDGDVVASLPTMSADTSYYAVVSQTKQKYTVSFSCGEEGLMEDVIKEYGQTLEAPVSPEREGYKFMAWYNDEACTALTEWPITVTGDTTVYAKWNEYIDLTALLEELLGGYELDPASFIPESMLKGYAPNLINAGDIVTDYTSFVDVSDITYGGFGEQWNMVLDNLTQSELFFNALTTVESISATAVAAFNNYIDSNPSNTATHTFSSGIYNVTIECTEDKILMVLDYTASFPIVGEQTAQIYLDMDRENGERSVRVQLGDPNALYYTVSEDSYTFAIKYLGVRRAYFTVERDDQGNVKGSINEFLTYQGVGLKSAADFYITDDYVSVVGNKASGILGFDNYITELYSTSTGRMLGYEIMEELTVAGKNVTYNTLWFNLADVEGITSIKYVPATDNTDAALYVNGLSAQWEYKTVGGLSLKIASRRYDIEFRTQYFYSYDATTETYTEYKVSVPMLFVQEENFDTLAEDVESKNGIDVAITVDSADLTKLMHDYDTLIEKFITNKQTVTEEVIIAFIGEAYSE